MQNKWRFFLIVWFIPSIVFCQKIGDQYVGARKFIKDGLALHNEGKFNEAINSYKLVHPADSFYSTALYEISFSHYKNKQYKEAINAAKKGLQLNDKIKREFYLNYGHAMDDAGFPDSAIIIYNKILTEFPYSYKVNYEKGVTYSKSKKYKEALENYLIAVRRNPLYASPHLRIGMLAAEANMPSLALLALQFYCIVQTNASSKLSVLEIMENICENHYKTSLEIPANTFNTYDELKELDDIVNSKAAFSNKYKSKVNLNYFFIKQVQVICERLPEKAYENDGIVNFYLDFYRKMWANDHFEGMIIYGLKSLDAKNVKAEAKKNEKIIDAFTSWAYDYLNEIRKNQTVVLDGVKRETSLWYGTDQNLEAIGKANAEGIKEGKWIYFNDSGFKVAEGIFDNNNKEGKWVYYYDNGLLKSVQNMHVGKLDGEYLAYQDNGVLTEQVFYKDDKAEGIAKVFNSNGTLKTEMNFEKDVRNGKRVNYDENGHKDSEYEEKNSKGEGKYTAFHPNGKVSIEGNLKDNNFHGPTVYYYKNGKVSKKAEFLNGDPVGSWKWYNENGTPKKEGQYLDGKEVGEWKYYNDNNQMSFIESYENGKVTGTAKSFDWYGKLLCKYSYSKGGKLDSYEIYDANGNVLAKEKSSGNKIMLRRYSTRRKVLEEGIMRDGKEDGIWKYNYPNGQLKTDVNFVDGAKSGIEKNYYKNGALNSEYLYVNGSIEGYFKSYHKNGKIKSEGFYKNNMSNGPIVFYFPNGMLNSKEYYVNDQITGLDEGFHADGKKSSHTVYQYGYYKSQTQFDSTGKQIAETIFDKGKGVYKYFSDNGKLTVKADYVNGRFNGKSTTYYTNGKLHSVKYCVDGKDTGGSKTYHENGQLSAVGNYKNDVRDSTWLYYNEEGKLTKMAYYKNDDLEGVYKTYYDNGKLEFDRTYLNDERHGDAYYYDPSGNLIMKLNYQFGVLESYSYFDKAGAYVPAIPVLDETGTVMAYYPTGKKSCEFVINKGYYEGKFIDYYENGNIMSETNYKNHENEGLTVEYYPNGKMKSERDYFYGELNGISKYYFDSGKLKMIESYLNGTRHGLSKEYDATGKLIKTTNYIYGEIIN